MRTYVLFVLIFAFNLTAHSSNLDYPDYLDNEYVELLKKEFVKEMNSVELKIDLKEKFISLFDDIKKVHAQYSENNGFYYIVFGNFNGKEKIELIKINEIDIINSTYTYINFEDNIDYKNLEYCVSGDGNFFPPGCPTPNECVDSFTGFCRTIICGIWNGKTCTRF